MRAAETIEQDQRAWELWVARLTEREIAGQLGLSRAGAHEAIKRGRAMNRSPETDELKKDELAELDRVSRQLWAIVLDNHPKVDHGRVIYLPNLTDSGKPKILFDPRINLQAYRELRAIGARRAALMGLDAPTQIRVETVTEDQVDGWIAELEAKLADNDPESADR